MPAEPVINQREHHAMSDKKTITLTVRSTDITFAPTTEAYNRYINELMPNDKVAPSHNFLKRVVVEESKPALDDALKLPGAALSIAGALSEQFVPDLEIEVKN